ncbi:hypothetical protein Ddc_09783 [Ditylenchus destructor]|nr:hypothetical protein Ddc_09783 [Ditylenchus destructor]
MNNLKKAAEPNESHKSVPENRESLAVKQSPSKPSKHHKPSVLPKSVSLRIFPNNKEESGDQRFKQLINNLKMAEQRSTSDGHSAHSRSSSKDRGRKSVKSVTLDVPLVKSEVSACGSTSTKIHVAAKESTVNQFKKAVNNLKSLAYPYLSISSTQLPTVSCIVLDPPQESQPLLQDAASKNVPPSHSSSTNNLFEQNQIFDLPQTSQGMPGTKARKFVGSLLSTKMGFALNKAQQGAIAEKCRQTVMMNHGHHIIVTTCAIKESHAQLQTQKSPSTSGKTQPMENTSPLLAPNKSFQEKAVHEIGKNGDRNSDIRELASTSIGKFHASENSNGSSDDFLARWHRRSPTLLGKMPAEPPGKSSKAPGVENEFRSDKSPQRNATTIRIKLCAESSRKDAEISEQNKTAPTSENGTKEPENATPMGNKENFTRSAENTQFTEEILQPTAASNFYLDFDFDQSMSLQNVQTADNSETEGFSPARTLVEARSRRYIPLDTNFDEEKTSGGIPIENIPKFHGTLLSTKLGLAFERAEQACRIEKQKRKYNHSPLGVVEDISSDENEPSDTESDSGSLSNRCSPRVPEEKFSEKAPIEFGSSPEIESKKQKLDWSPSVLQRILDLVDGKKPLDLAE